MKSTILLLLALIASVLIWSKGHGPTPRTAPTGAPSSPVVGGTDCADRYLGGMAPEMPAAQSKRAHTLCFSAFASMSSPATRTPLWAAEALTPASVREARATERVSEFHAEPRLPDDVGAELGDYRRSGWDRGHLAPSGDMPGLDAQQESFSLANIVPQAADLNRGAWSDLESDVRSLASRRDVVYVVTGVLFEGGAIRRTPSGRVSIPTSVWKAVASPGEGSAVFIASNDDEPEWRTMTVDSFEKRTGIDPFPGMATDDRARLLRVGGR